MRRVPLILQSKRNECGLACLAMVIGSHDRTVTLPALRRRFCGFGQGATLKDLAQCADDLGFLSRGLRAEPKHLKHVRKPAILHWNMDHFVVLVAVNRRGCVIHDPALGKVLCPWPEVDQKFTGVVLELWRDTPRAALFDRDGRNILPVLQQLTDGTGRQMTWICMLSALLQLMVLAAPWHVQWTVDEALVAADEHLVGVLCLGFALLLVCRVLTNYIRGLLVVQLGHVLSFRFASGLLHHLLHLPVLWFEQRHVGDVVSRFASLAPIRDLLTQGAAAGLVDTCIVLLSLGLMWIYAPTLAAGVLLVHLCFVLLQLLLVPRFRRVGMALVNNEASEQSHLLESVQAIHNVKVYACEGDRLARWQSLHAQTLSQSMQLQRLQLHVATGVTWVMGAEFIVLIYFAAHQVLGGALTLGMFFALISYRGYFTERLHSLVDQLINLCTLQVHLQRVAEIWDEPAEVVSQSGHVFPQAPAALELCKVAVRHSPKQPPVFQDLDLVVKAGEFVAIIGASGSGKTTVLKLLMGLLSPSAGEVEWAGYAFTPQARVALRGQSGCVLQGDRFFSGSLLDNIVLFDPPDLPRVYTCLEAVGLTATLRRLPMGLHTHVGDLGSAFSSGEMQRLLLVRALYRRPNYLFLDEGTANLDVASSTVVREVLSQLSCSRVIVTHDLAFAAAADRVLLLEDGVLRRVELRAKSAEVLSAG